MTNKGFVNIEVKPTTRAWLKRCMMKNQNYDDFIQEVLREANFGVYEDENDT